MNKLDLIGQKFGRGLVLSVDRIDNDLGYLRTNIQIIHKDINRMKSDFNQDYFIQMCKLIGRY